MPNRSTTMAPKEISLDPEKVAQLHKALEDPTSFREFAAHPKSFAAQFGLFIDDEISERLASKLKGISSLDMLGEHMDVSVGLITRALAKTIGYQTNAC
jgi:hypothetical protein